MTHLEPANLSNTKRGRSHSSSMRSSLELTSEPAPPPKRGVAPQVTGPEPDRHRPLGYFLVAAALISAMVMGAVFLSHRTRTSGKSAAHASDSGVAPMGSMRLKGTTEAV